MKLTYYNARLVFIIGGVVVGFVIILILTGEIFVALFIGTLLGMITGNLLGLLAESIIKAREEKRKLKVDSKNVGCVFIVVGVVLGLFFLAIFEDIFGLVFGIIIGGFWAFVAMLTSEPEKKHSPKKTAKEEQAELDFYMTALLSLSAAVIKADNRILPEEIEYVRRFFVREFGESKTNEYILELHALLDQELDLKNICLGSRAEMNMAYRLQLLHYLFGIANIDGNIADQESAVIYEISTYLQISSADFYSIRAMYVRTERLSTMQRINNNYIILEIQPNVSNEEVKKAYREMAKKFHPDKLAHLGSDVQKAANEKFQKINAAYEAIKRERGM